MIRKVLLLTLSAALYGCGSDSEDASSTGYSDSDDSGWAEYVDEEVGTGSMSIELPGEHGSGESMCSMNITRDVEKRLASVMLTLDVIGKGCDGRGNCDSPDVQSGVLTYSGGIDGDQPFATMILNYEPPGDGEEPLFWMYNAIYKSAPFSSFTMWVDGEPFNVLTSDTREAEDLSKGPHIWSMKIGIVADMLLSTGADDQASPPLQTAGEFSYDGLCEVSAKYMNL